MAKRKVTHAEMAGRRLNALISASQIKAADDDEKLCTIIGCSAGTLRNRRKDPGGYTFTQIFRLAEHYGWTAEQLAEVTA